MNKIYSTALPADNVILITRLLLRKLQVPVTDATIRDTFLSHPDHPSLLSISDSLRKWDVDAVAMRVNNGVNELPCPFIAHIDDDPGLFVIVESFQSGFVSYATAENITLRIPIKEFIDKWDHIALFVESKSSSGEENYQRRKQQELWLNNRVLAGLVILVLIGLLQLLQSNGQFIYRLSFFACNAAGMFITAMLLWLEYDQSNAFLKTVCAVSGTTDCNAVLSSKGAKLGGISLSEAGFVYFTGAFIYQAMGMPLYALSILSLVAAVFPFYSLFYQAFIIKKWCVLCLAVQALLLTEGLLTIFMAAPISAQFSLPPLLLAFFLPAFAWIVARPYLYEVKEKRNAAYRLGKLKNNAAVFQQILQMQQPMHALKETAGILLGNPAAGNTLVKVCSPYCIPCANMHSRIDRLLETGNWKVQIIFTAGASALDKEAFAAAYLLNKANACNDARSRLRLLRDWYAVERFSPHLFSSPENAMQSFQQQLNELKYMHNWCSAANIVQTPTIYINGYLMPEQYDVNDLDFL